MGESERATEQPHGASSPEPSVPSEIRRGERVVRLSNLDKLYWPEQRITKGDLLRYYRDVAPTLLPHIRDRPFTMKRYPDGWQGRPFFRKDVTNYAPAWVKRAAVRVTSRGSAAEPHDRSPGRERRARLALDGQHGVYRVPHLVLAHRQARAAGPGGLRPRPSQTTSPSRRPSQVALLVKQALDALGLASFPKTSGALGLHVLVPIERRHTYEETRRLATEVARSIAGTHADVATTEWSKAKRRGVLIDASQNAKGKTIASVYSVRPMPEATVSTPLHWDEVNEKLDPSIYTMAAVLDRLDRHGDLHEGALKTKQRLGPALRTLES